MDDRLLARPFEESPSLVFPVELLRRMVTTHVSAQEFQVVLIVALVTRKTGSQDAAVSEDALLRHELSAFAGQSEGTPVLDETWIWQPLEQALLHGLLLRFNATIEGIERGWYLLNSIENAQFVSGIVNGTLPAPEYTWIENVAPRLTADRPTVFRLYEQNIGPLTPLLAERLIHAVELYPVDWIESAISEAVAYNRRNWRYIARILENWAADGLPTSSGTR